MHIIHIQNIEIVIGKVRLENISKGGGGGIPGGGQSKN